MAPNRIARSMIDPSCSPSLSQIISSGFPRMDDDDFQDCPSPCFNTTSTISSLPPQPRSRNSTASRPFKKLKTPSRIHPGNKNRIFDEVETDLGRGLDEIEPTLDLLNAERGSNSLCSNHPESFELLNLCGEEGGTALDKEFLEEESTRLDELLKLCADEDDSGHDDFKDDYEEEETVNSVSCPLCATDISGLSDEMRQIHTNECLDKVEYPTGLAASNDVARENQCPGQVVDGSPLNSVRRAPDLTPVIGWLHKLGLTKYEETFVRQEIDWDALQRLTEEDLCSIGITALGPRKKILHALKELQNDSTTIAEPKTDISKGLVGNTRLGTNKLITDYFSDPLSRRKGVGIAAAVQKTTVVQNNARNMAIPTHRTMKRKDCIRNGKQKDVPLWCCIPGTPFRVDAFKYLRRDCSHWFLTHFHLDHYQGLTKSFSHGILYCSAITAKLVNMKIGIPWDQIQVLPLNEKINIAGIDVTCFDANHCPGAIIILFELLNGKHVLHTGDFRFCDEMKEQNTLQACRIHSLILDTTYCDPQYDFPKQDAVIQFVIDAIQAEAFNPKTLFLIGSYTIGKERIFIEVARALHKKIYVTPAKLRIIKCLGLQQEDMQWFTVNEHESHIHVVPMWAIASFKRLKLMSNQYKGRFSLIVAFSPTGWSMGKGKKSTGRRWQQGTIIRYEVPYSEHSSFTELREFVKFISPANIIPSVNNHGPDSHHSMVSQLIMA